ncbi:putative porin [Pedobacter sp.]|jgi:hypothetical protein|uniref:putative porin n=1 Tax=Pedobacter sp. TaxID=1411316 RepID=UPI002CB3B8FA|nr:putative porin [Pedobacter sp.]HWW40587.1 putative porin [Pedobacter sp.]
MYKFLVLSVLFCLLLFGQGAFAQDLKTTVRENKELDSLRKKLDGGKDSVVFTSKYVRYTTLGLTRDSIQTFPLDTSLRNFQNYSVLNQPRRPTINTGGPGLAAQLMLFEPSKSIGFDPGFHSFDLYKMSPEDIIYYQARTQFSNLYYVSGGPEQVFKATHTQNIKPNLNVGANYYQIGSKGVYNNQKANDLNTSLFTWYQSPNKRYNLWATAIFSSFKAGENGTVNNDNLFTNVDATQRVSHEAEVVRLTTAKQRWHNNIFFLKQSYFIGRIDTVEQPVMKKVLPTNKITYTVSYNTQSFGFSKSETDDHSVLPKGLIDTVSTNDSTSVSHLRNEFIYSFFLRGKSQAFIKNELKIDVGIRHDYYKYTQLARYANLTNYYDYSATFQNSTLLGALGYRFSDRMDLNVDLQQIFQGRQIGDFLYEAKSNVRLSNAAGRVVLGAYIQNKSPEEVYIRYFGNHYNWAKGLDRTKTVNLSFNYINDKYKFEAGAKYYLINKYLYFAQVDSGVDIAPTQEAGSINLLKVTVGKKVDFGKFHLDSYLVYQKTDSKSILRTPEVYTFNSLYRNQTFFKVLKTDVGIDLRYNTPYDALAYSPAASQFYTLNNGPQLKTEPIIDVWVRASLRKANLFVKYDYVNQGLFSKGYYSVYKYPMPDRMLKFGVSWNFYD